MGWCRSLLVALMLGGSAVWAQNPLASADAAAAEIFRQTNSTAMVLVVVRNNEVHMQGFGQVYPGAAQAPGPNSLLRLCSLTKIFATDLLVKMLADKTVRLDDALQNFAPVNQLVPVQTLRGPAARPVTLGDLATHTAGLPREIGPVPAGARPFTFPDHDQRWTWLQTAKLRASPGTVALYSNVGFDLLGDALEAAAHEPYAQLVAERTTRPLGMNDTTFTPTTQQCSRLLLGFHAAIDEQARPGTCTPTTESAGSSGLYSTPLDMATWLKYLLGVSAIKQDGAAQAAYVFPANLKSVKGLDHAGVPAGIGLGWMILDQPETPTRIVEKTGGGGGFTTYIALDPAHRTGVFMALTEGNGPWNGNAFRATNDLLLGLSNLPPMAKEPVRMAAPVERKKATRKRRRLH